MLELHIKFLATLYTSLLMSALVGLLLFSDFKMPSPKIKGKVISAQMIDISQIQRTQPQKQQKPKQPKKQTPPKKAPTEIKEPIKVNEPKPPEPQPKPVISDPKPIAPKVNKIDEEQRKKDLERKKKLEEIRQRRLDAEKRAQEEAEYLESLNQKNLEEDASEPAIVSSQQGNQNNQELDEESKKMLMYQAAVISAVTQKWSKPPTAEKNLVCHVSVRQIPGGGVIDASISSPCNASVLVKKSIIDAIKKAEPLPYKGFESVFSRTATFIFAPKD